MCLKCRKYRRRYFRVISKVRFRRRIGEADISFKDMVKLRAPEFNCFFYAGAIVYGIYGVSEFLKREPG